MVISLVTYLAFAGVLFWWVILLAPWRPWGTQEVLEPSNEKDVSLKEITILIPARNEGSLIEQTLNALSLQGKGHQIIVVDDQSEDDTALQARTCGATVISGTTPPPGWSGKLWALEQGLAKVSTPYTLLLDADITLAPGMIAALLKKAREEHLVLVSLMATPSFFRLSEQLLMPAFVFFFKLLYPFRLANKPGSRIAAAAGGCILVETQALRKIGAFASLRDALIDDCTLASRIKRAGMPTWIGLSHSARSHREYEDIKTIWNMVARTAYTQLHYSPLLLIVCTLLMSSMFWFAPILLLFALPGQTSIVICMLAWIAMIIVYIPVLHYYQLSPLWALALPVIGTLFLLMTWTSAIRFWRGERAQWKNRRYEITT
ncbi:Hopene-associated glycosyltransferase HpnB [Nitrosomonas nitrosa]|uniref:Hopene-associated glycosyltransferase HpnB n=1 Tax=Nitrosomonas nitrosa TaxID=52442 RepID=A0A1I4L3K6_9PROT|nr:glycosyltransferase [Nitrosomonas nitrosa]CAE6503579.1 Hopene-associated glycosyltransferase HpnB [Nitrosomonas nitrosa]SFL85501.1 hopene-associated glycosyltransferase HpnB [Nitrosomonas nitrosa]